MRSRVTNIRPYVADAYQHLNTREFRDHLLLRIFGVNSRADVPEYTLSADDWAQVAAIRAERFANWDWNYGRSPAFTSERYHKYPQGAVDFRFNVEQGGNIKEIKIYGDFFGVGDIADVEKRLTGIPYRRDAIAAAFADFDTALYFGGIAAKDLIDQLVG